jgi:MFS family permease
MSAGDVQGTGDSFGRRREEARVARPQRPELSDRTPPPVTGKAAVPLALRRSQTMWYVAVALLFFAVVMIVMTRSSLVSNLTELLHDQDATVSETRLADVTPLIVYLAIAALLVVALPEWAFATRLSRRRGWPRVVLVPVAMLHLFVVFLVAILIPLSAWQGWLLVFALIFGGLLALVAAVRAFSPSVTAWLRAQDEAEAERQAAG